MAICSQRLLFFGGDQLRGIEAVIMGAMEILAAGLVL